MLIKIVNYQKKFSWSFFLTFEVVLINTIQPLHSVDF